MLLRLLLGSLAATSLMAHAWLACRCLPAVSPRRPRSRQTGAATRCGHLMTPAHSEAFQRLWPSWRVCARGAEACTTQSRCDGFSSRDSSVASRPAAAGQNEMARKPRLCAPRQAGLAFDTLPCNAFARSPKGGSVRSVGSFVSSGCVAGVTQRPNDWVETSVARRWVARRRRPAIPEVLIRPLSRRPRCNAVACRVRLRRSLHRPAIGV